MQFLNRSEAGRKLAERLQQLVGDNVVVLGLSRGGVPVAFEVARAMRAPLDVIIVRKISVPHRPELAMGAIGEGGARVVNEEITRAFDVNESEFVAAERQEHLELARLVRCLRGNRAQVSLVGRTVIVVDDGIATGSTARAACQIARVRGATRVILAVPVSMPAALMELSDVTDEIICLKSAQPLYSVGHWYADFSQTSDNQVVNLLNRAARWIEPHADDAENEQSN